MVGFFRVWDGVPTSKNIASGRPEALLAKSASPTFVLPMDRNAYTNCVGVFYMESNRFCQ
jgi:hypothetical protein